MLGIDRAQVTWAQRDLLTLVRQCRVSLIAMVSSLNSSVLNVVCLHTYQHTKPPIWTETSLADAIVTI